MNKIISVLIALLWASTVLAGVESEEHRKAIELARQEKYKEALAIFDQIVKKEGWYEELVYDYMAVLTWQNKYQESYNLYQKHSKTTCAAKLPNYVISILAKNCLELKKFAKARQYYHCLLKKHPGDVDAHIGLARILFAEDNPYEVPHLLQPVKNSSQKVDVLKLIARAYFDMGFYVDALRHFDDILKINPKDQEANQGRARSLNELVAPYEAAKIKPIAYSPKIDSEVAMFGKELLQKTKSIQAAVDLHWGMASDYPENFKYYQNALDKLMVQMKEKKDEKLILFNIYDSILVHKNKNMFKEAILTYETLLANGKTNDDIPLGYLESVADCYLSLRKLKQAKTLYHYILNKAPTRMGSLKGMYYVLLESEELEESINFIEDHKFDHKKILSIGKQSFPNDNAEALQELSRESYYNAGLLEKAEKTLKKAVQIAPFNSTFRRLLAETYLSKDLPRTAENELNIARTNEYENDQKDVELKISYFNVYMALARYAEAEKILNDLKINHADRENIVKLQDQWNSYKAREIDGKYSYEKGGGINGKATSALESKMYSSPIAYNFRGFLSGRYTNGKFDEGTLDYYTGGVGIAYRGTLLKTALEVYSSHFRGKTKAGTIFDIDITPSDHWDISGRVEINSPHEIPGRAFVNGITSDYFQAGVHYLYNHAFKAGADVFDQEFSQNNRWKGIKGFAQAQLYEGIKKSLDVRVDIGTKRARTNDVPYYSPLRDSYVSVSPIFKQTLYRNYELSFKHVITPFVGRYWERGYKTAWTFGATYEQIWDYQNWYYLSYGFTRKRSTYDGDNEYSTTYFVNFNMRF